jgi:endoglucanase
MRCSVPFILTPLLLVLLNQPRPAATPPTSAIKVDQAGYLSTASKLAMVVSDPAAASFRVVRDDESVAYEGRLSAPVGDPDSGDRVQQADFSELTADGTYQIDVPGVGRSWTFRIGTDVSARPLYLALRSFYGQRCNAPVDLGPAFPGYRHDACHRDGAFHVSSGRAGTAPAAGGWHDAGDYGRYVVNSGLSTGTLLWAWELFQPVLVSLRLDIPESNNRTPDVLDEIRWNLQWMLSMQDRDGGVWHKQTSERFPAFIMPEADRLPSLVVGAGAAPWKSSCATADFVAVMAIAGRVYKPYDRAFARASLQAARRAWTWLEQYPDVPFRNPTGIGTGEYGDRDCSDERLWAAAELWRTTREDGFERVVVGLGEHFLPMLRATGPPSWASVAPMGLWTYALGGGRSAPLRDAVILATRQAADAIADRTSTNAYHVSLTPGDYVWGSNGVVANYGLQLLVADALGPSARYRSAAIDNLHYLLGRNTFSLSWVTQVGANPYRHPHHRPSGADNNAEPWPGLLSGGPNRSRQDPAMRKKLPADLPPAKSYLDDQDAYAANEVAINWNAPLVFLLAGVQGK